MYIGYNQVCWLRCVVVICSSHAITVSLFPQGTKTTKHYLHFSIKIITSIINAMRWIQLWTEDIFLWWDFLSSSHSTQMETSVCFVQLASLSSTVAYFQDELMFKFHESQTLFLDLFIYRNHTFLTYFLNSSRALKYESGHKGPVSLNAYTL